MTRDSIVWVVGIVASVCVFLGAHFDMVQAAFPAVTDIWQARIELAAACTGFLSALLRMSPLALNPENAMAIVPDTALPPHRSEALNPPVPPDRRLGV